MKRRVESWTETREVWVVRRLAARVETPDWCADCAAPAAMLTPEEAGALAAVTTRTVYHWVESGVVHFQESAAGAVYVCLTSLQRAAG